MAPPFFFAEHEVKEQKAKKTFVPVPVHFRAPPASFETLHEFQVHQLNSYLDEPVKTFLEEVLQVGEIACLPSITHVGSFGLFSLLKKKKM